MFSGFASISIFHFSRKVRNHRAERRTQRAGNFSIYFHFSINHATPKKKSSSLDKLSLFFHCAIYRSNLFLINPNFILISDLIIKKFYWKISEKFQVFNSSKAFLSFPFTTIFESDSSSLKVKSASLFLSNQN